MPTDPPFPRTLQPGELLAAHGFEPKRPLDPRTLQRIARAVKRFGIDKSPQPITINGVDYHVVDVTFRSVTSGRA
jgi:hypothetical protein